MVPRFSLSVPFVHDAVHTRAPYTRVHEGARLDSVVRARLRQRECLPQYSDYRNAVSVLRTREPAPSVEGQVPIVLVVSMVLE